MSRIVYVNGEYLREADAKISIFDRGFLMADGVYEVTSVLGGKLIDFPGHVARLARSLAELDMASPATADELLEIHRELVARNGIDDGMVYLQVTRGSAGDRDFVFPDPAVVPSSLVMFTQSKPGMADNPAAKTGWRVISIPDIRWGRRDIKTVQLLYPSMGKMMAKKARRGRRLVRRGRVRDRRHLEQRLYREGRQDHHAGAVLATSCTGSPAPPCCALPQRRRWRSRSGHSPWSRLRAPTRPSSPRPRPS